MTRSRRFLKLMSGLCLLSTGVLSACTWFDDDGMFRNRSKDYQEVVERPAIQVPEGADNVALGELYVVPSIPETSTLLEADSGAPRPRPLTGSASNQEVKIQSLGDKRWILINRPPSEVWPRVRSILNRNALPSAKTNAREGVLETVWLEMYNDTLHRHRFRLLIQPGVQIESTEVSVLHQQRDQDANGTEWPLNSDDAEREKALTDLVASGLAGDGSSGAVSLLAQNIGGESKVEIIAVKGREPYILMRLDFDRAWASAGYATERDGFTRVDQDRSAGVFYINYQDDQDKDSGGFLSRMFGGDEAEGPAAEAAYRIDLGRGEEGVELRLRAEGQGTLERSEAVRLLKKIRANLS